jgi:hypothetical protein
MTVPVIEALRANDLLVDRFGSNALLLFALELRFNIEDIVTEAATCLTDDVRDKKCDALYIDKESQTAVIAQAWTAESPDPKRPRSTQQGKRSQHCGRMGSRR